MLINTLFLSKQKVESGLITKTEAVDKPFGFLFSEIMNVNSNDEKLNLVSEHIGGNLIDYKSVFINYSFDSNVVLPNIHSKTGSDPIVSLSNIFLSEEKSDLQGLKAIDKIVYTPQQFVSSISTLIKSLITSGQSNSNPELKLFSKNFILSKSIDGENLTNIEKFLLETIEKETSFSISLSAFGKQIFFEVHSQVVPSILSKSSVDNGVTNNNIDTISSIKNTDSSFDLNRINYNFSYSQSEIITTNQSDSTNLEALSRKSPAEFVVSESEQKISTDDIKLSDSNPNQKLNLYDVKTVDDNFQKSGKLSTSLNDNSAFGVKELNKSSDNYANGDDSQQIHLKLDRDVSHNKQQPSDSPTADSQSNLVNKTVETTIHKNSIETNSDSVNNNSSLKIIIKDDNLSVQSTTEETGKFIRELSLSDEKSPKPKIIEVDRVIAYRQLQNTETTPSSESDYDFTNHLINERQIQNLFRTVSLNKISPSKITDSNHNNIQIVQGNVYQSENKPYLQSSLTANVNSNQEANSSIKVDSHSNEVIQSSDTEQVNSIKVFSSHITINKTLNEKINNYQFDNPNNKKDVPTVNSSKPVLNKIISHSGEALETAKVDNKPLKGDLIEVDVKNVKNGIKTNSVNAERTPESLNIKKLNAEELNNSYAKEKEIATRNNIDTYSNKVNMYKREYNDYELTENLSKSSSQKANVNNNLSQKYIEVQEQELLDDITIKRINSVVENSKSSSNELSRKANEFVEKNTNNQVTLNNKTSEHGNIRNNEKPLDDQSYLYEDEVVKKTFSDNKTTTSSIDKTEKLQSTSAKDVSEGQTTSGNSTRNYQTYERVDQFTDTNSRNTALNKLKVSFEKTIRDESVFETQQLNNSIDGSDNIQQDEQIVDDKQNHNFDNRAASTLNSKANGEQVSQNPLRVFSEKPAKGIVGFKAVEDNNQVKQVIEAARLTNDNNTTQHKRESDNISTKEFSQVDKSLNLNEQSYSNKERNDFPKNNVELLESSISTKYENQSQDDFNNILFGSEKRISTPLSKNNFEPHLNHNKQDYTKFFESKTLENFVKNINSPNLDVRSELSNVNRSNNSIELRLYPEELGRVKITIDNTENVVSAKIEVQTEQARALILSNLPRLKESLNQEGLNVHHLNVALGSDEQRNNNTGNQKKRNSNGQLSTDVEEQAEEYKVRNLGYNTVEYLA
jgi:flagellar hook-length control protein FliK